MVSMLLRGVDWSHALVKCGKYVDRCDKAWLGVNPQSWVNCGGCIVANFFQLFLFLIFCCRDVYIGIIV